MSNLKVVILVALAAIVLYNVSVDAALDVHNENVSGHMTRDAYIDEMTR